MDNKSNNQTFGARSFLLFDRMNFLCEMCIFIKETPPMKSLNINDNEANFVVQLNNIWWSKPFISYFNTLIEQVIER